MKKQNQHKINQQIEQLVTQKAASNQLYTDAEKALIAQYEGSGGQGSKGATGQGVLYEFFTPDYVCEIMWKLAFRYGFKKDGKVLEPSIGTGRLIADAPDYKNCVGFEINPISAKITEALYPGCKVHEGYFETAFLEPPRFTSRLPKNQLTWLKEYPFDLVIGNPPYGKYKNLYSSYFRSPKIPQIEQYFMYYGLQLLKPGGLLVYLTSSNFLRNGLSYNEVKEKVMQPECELLDAYRLPSIFRFTDVPIDILIFKRK